MEARISTLEQEKSRRTHGVATAETVLTDVMAPFPKTTDTTNLLDRELTKRAALDESTGTGTDTDTGTDNGGRRSQQRSQEELVRRWRMTSAGYIIGTSVGFEVVILCIAAWRFCRRDY